MFVLIQWNFSWYSFRLSLTMQSQLTDFEFQLDSNLYNFIHGSYERMKLLLEDFNVNFFSHTIFLIRHGWKDGYRKSLMYSNFQWYLVNILSNEMNLFRTHKFVDNPLFSLKYQIYLNRNVKYFFTKCVVVSQQRKINQHFLFLVQISIQKFKISWTCYEVIIWLENIIFNMGLNMLNSKYSLTYFLLRCQYFFLNPLVYLNGVHIIFICFFQILDIWYL